MKTKFLQTAVVIYLGAAVLMLLSACGGQSSNPLQKYSLKGEPVTGVDKPSENQTVFSGSYFTLETDLPDQKVIGNFIEEQPGQLLIKITPKTPHIKKFSVSLVNCQHQQQPIINTTTTPGIFAVVWTPPKGILSTGTDFKIVKAYVQITTTESTDARLINIGDQPKEITLHVTRNNQLPKIIGYTKLDRGIDEGQKVPFTVDIEDPASATNPRIPDILIKNFRFSNTEAFVADGAYMLAPDLNRSANVEKIGPTKWRFHYILNADKFVENRNRKGNVDPNFASVQVCFFIRAISSNNTFSEEFPQVCFDGRYASQPPLLTWDDSALKEIKTGVESQLKFSIKSSNGLGKTEIKDPAKALASLPGSKNLKCSPANEQNLESQNCVLTWTPTCSRTDVVKKLIFKVDNSVNGKSKSQNFEKEITLLSNEELCPAKRPTVPSKEKGVAQ